MTLSTLDSSTMFVDDDTEITAGSNAIVIGPSEGHVNVLTIKKPTWSVLSRFFYRAANIAHARAIEESGVNGHPVAIVDEPEGENCIEWFDWMARQEDFETALCGAMKAQMVPTLLEWALGYIAQDLDANGVPDLRPLRKRDRQVARIVEWADNVPQPF